MSGHWIPPGTVILIGSLSELVSKGVAGYLVELADFSNSLKQKFGNVVQVIPFVPLAMGGLNSAFAVRSVAELAAWLGGTGDYPLPNLTEAVWQFLSKGGDGPLQSQYESRFVVPVDLTFSGSKTVHSNGWPFLRNGSIAINEAEELRQVTALISDLNEGMAFTLDEGPSFNRSPTSAASTAGRGTVKRFVVLGASHGHRIAETLEKSGFDVTDLTDRGWKLSKTGVTVLADKLAQADVPQGKETQLILSVLDSSIFWGESNEGLEPSKKLSDNRFHIEGRVVVAGRDVIQDRFNMLAPLLQVASKYRICLFSPIPRYITGGCCKSTSHCCGHEEDSAAHEQLLQLERARGTLRDIVFKSKFKNVMILNPVKLFGGGRDLDSTAEALKAVWGPDPVHPASEVYQRIVDEMVLTLDGQGNDKLRNRGRKRGRSPDEEHSATDSSNRSSSRPRGGLSDGWKRGSERGSRPYHGGNYNPRGNWLGRSGGSRGRSDYQQRPLSHRGGQGGREDANRGWRKRSHYY